MHSFLIIKHVPHLIAGIVILIWSKIKYKSLKFLVMKKSWVLQEGYNKLDLNFLYINIKPKNYCLIILGFKRYLERLA